MGSRSGKGTTNPFLGLIYRFFFFETSTRKIVNFPKFRLTQCKFMYKYTGKNGVDKLWYR